MSWSDCRGLGCLDVSSLVCNSPHAVVGMCLFVCVCVMGRWGSCSAGGLRLCWDKGEMSGAQTVWTSWLTAGCSLFFVLVIVSFLSLSPLYWLLSSRFPPSPLSPIPNSHSHSIILPNVPPPHTPPFLSLSLYLSLPHLQCCLELSSTGSNRHWIAINPASLDLPIVILLKKEVERKEAKEEEERSGDESRDEGMQGQMRERD